MANASARRKLVKAIELSTDVDQATILAFALNEIHETDRALLDIKRKAKEREGQ
jgi:hypothetical protein